jgi:2-keto-4-pentenoate hydratase
LDTEIDALAARQLLDYKNLVPGTYFGEAHCPLSIAEAYQVQAAVSRLRVKAGDEILGYKVGCTGPGIVEQFGLSGPIRGTLFRSELRCPGATLDYSAFANLAIEGEMAVLVGERGTIVDAFPVIELHNFVFRGERKTLSELIVNNGLNAGIVLPWAINSARARRGDVLKVFINGSEIDGGDLWCFPGGARDSVKWLTSNLREHGLELRSGNLVLAGTPLGLHPVKPGDHIRVTVDHDQYAECRIR